MKRKYFLSNSIELAKKCKGRKDFCKRYYNAYKLLLQKHPEELEKIFPSNKIKWNKSDALAKAFLYKSMREFKEKSPKAYQYLKRQNLLKEALELMDKN